MREELADEQHSVCVCRGAHIALFFVCRYICEYVCMCMYDVGVCMCVYRCTYMGVCV